MSNYSTPVFLLSFLKKFSKSPAFYKIMVLSHYFTSLEMRHYDYIIAGSGLAGLYTAYLAANYGKVALLTKSGITESNSYFAQGGIAAVTDEDDAPALHFEETTTAGRGERDYPAADILGTEGPQRIR